MNHDLYSKPLRHNFQCRLQHWLYRRLFGWRLLAAALATMLWGAAFADSADQAKIQTSSDSRTYSARAMFSGDPAQSFDTTAQPNKLAAAMGALQACENTHAGTGRAEFCELVQLDGNPISTSASIMHKVPKQPHPLFLWKYEAGASTVYLGGSVHILRPGIRIPRQFQQAFDQAGVLGLEVDLSAYDEQQLQQITIGHALLTGGQTLRKVLPPATYQALQQVTAEYGLPLDQMAQFKPAFVTQQLAVMALMSVGYNPQLGVEHHFTNQARTKTIVELETLQFQLELLLNQPLPVQATLTAEMMGQMQNFEPLTAELLLAWLSGDDKAFAAAFDAQTGTSPEAIEFMHQLMDERNIGMAQKISQYLQQPGTYFILAGAAHFVGDNSIIRLLDQQGISGERVLSNQDLDG